MIKYHGPQASKKYIAGYDLLKPYFRAPGFYGQTLAPSLELHTHDEARVKEVLKNIQYPDGGKIDLHIYNLSYNLPDFYNGIAASQLNDRFKGPTGVILLGRTTSIPFVMTEFVVPHEIGHCYQYRYLPDYHGGRDESGKQKENDKNWKIFLEMMGMSKKHGRTGRHNEVPSEIFANTFRILFSPYQHDFWPHNIRHPLKIKNLKAFLTKAMREE